MQHLKSVKLFAGKGFIIRLEKFGGNATPLNGGKIRTGVAPKTDTATRGATTGRQVSGGIIPPEIALGTGATHTAPLVPRLDLLRES